MKVSRIVMLSCAAMMTAAVATAQGRDNARRVAAAEKPSVNLKSLYDEHDWFALRNAIQKTEAPALYRGTVEAAFNQPGAAEKDLRRVIADSPKSDAAFQAHELLAEMFFREGQCKESMTEVSAMMQLKPDDHSEDGGRIFCEAVSDADLKVIQDSAAIGFLKMRDSYMLPVTVNGKQGYYGFDTGSNISTMGESEAQRLGLVSKAAGSGFGAALHGVSIHAVVVPRLVVGNTVLSDVAFAVFSDKQEPWADLPQGERGLLGLPVLLALKSFTWTKQGSFEIHPGWTKVNAIRPNVCFDGTIACVWVDYAGWRLTFGLDTGADATTLYPRFAARFPGLVKREGKSELSTGAGYDGTVTQRVTQLPEMALLVGGIGAVVRPVRVVPHVGPNATKWFYGNLGMDVLGQADEVTIDFQHMTLTR